MEVFGEQAVFSLKLWVFPKSSGNSALSSLSMRLLTVPCLEIDVVSLEQQSKLCKL